MSWSGSGIYNLPGAYSPETVDTVIDPARYNGLTTDLASGITACLAKNGENVPTANLPMGGFKHTGAADGAAAGQYLTYAQSTASYVGGNFGVGTAPGGTFKLEVQGSGRFYSNAAGTYGLVALGRTSDEAQFALVANANEFITGTVAGDVVFRPTGGKLWLGVTGGVRVGGSGNVTIPAPSSGVALAVTGVANTAAGSFSTGASFGNAANTDATVLDWYEEGTFTPTGSGMGSPSYSSQAGVFTRIGNKVQFALELVWTGGTLGANIAVTGLPYSAKSGGGYQMLNVMVNKTNSSFTWTGSLFAYINNSSIINVYVHASGALATALLNPSGTKDLYLSGEYLV